MSRSVKDIVAHDYHDWIVSLIDTPDSDYSVHYSKLMWILDDIEYISLNWSDDNRVADAFLLRNRYDDEENCHRLTISKRLSDKNPSILEVLSALFTRYSDDILTEPGDPSVGFLMFETVLRDLDLLKCDDFFTFSRSEIEEKTLKWMVGDKKTYTECIKSDKNLGLWEACGYWARGHFGV
jgi:hypothetical protein